MKGFDDMKVINKFLIWYESLSHQERIIFERVLGRIINALPRSGEE
jgi:hypothetical protein